MSLSKNDVKKVADSILKDKGTMSVSKMLYEIYKNRANLGKDIQNAPLKQVHDFLCSLGIVEWQEYFTSEETSKSLANLILKLHNWQSEILDFWSWIWQITKYLNGFWVWFERQEEYVEIAKEEYDVKSEKVNFHKELKSKDINRFSYCVWNPPFSSKTNKKFLGKYLKKITTKDCEFIMLLPDNYEKKLENLGYKVYNWYNVEEDFLNTDIRTKIFCFNKKE